MIEAIKSRRSIRKYIDKEIEEKKLVQILESGRLAPSGSNTQPWHFIVIKSKENKDKVAKVSHDQKWMATAPVQIVCVADVRSRTDANVEICVDENSKEEEVKQIIRDTAISVEHMSLTATELGLGTCWVAWFTQEEFRPVLNIPDDKYVLCVLTIGYADEDPKPRPRKKLEDIVHYEEW
jgi:nitroreductase